jgi:hypothetical protein
VGLVPVGRHDVPVGEILFGSQVALGKRRAAERDTRFPADEHDWPVEPLLPQRGGGGAAGLATSDDHHRPRPGSVGHAASSPSASIARHILCYRPPFGHGTESNQALRREGVPGRRLVSAAPTAGTSTICEIDERGGLRSRGASRARDHDRVGAALRTSSLVRPTSRLPSGRRNPMRSSWSPESRRISRGWLSVDTTRRERRRL